MSRENRELSLTALTNLQKERLAYLELKAFFVGELRRADLETRFGIKPAAASRDLNAYRAIAPENLTYDASGKAYIPTERFQPLFGFSAERVLSWLLNGFGDGLEIKLRRTIPCAGTGSLVSPNFDILARLTRAIHAATPVRIRYLSLSSGESERVIVPTALADNGLRWHVRGFDRTKSRFSDFVLTRITSVRALPEHAQEHEGLLADAQWNRIVDLELVPHPDIVHPEAIASDYAMTEGVLKLQIRAALTGYALNRWSVDCSANHSLDSRRHQLWLRNPQSLYGVESARLAPGYNEGMA